MDRGNVTDIELTKSDFCDNDFIDVKICIEGCLKYNLATEFTLHLRNMKTAINSEKQPDNSERFAVFSLAERRKPRISADNETAFAVNFLEKQRKQRETRSILGCRPAA